MALNRRPPPPTEAQLRRWLELCENRAAGCRVTKFRAPALNAFDQLDDIAELWDELAAYLRDLL